ncbi:ubiquitin-specific protease ubp15 [Pleodorina starrii]|uniref:Ubiquitin-specific protease ubp15 n=1 Tax=Pleodorina starrii TaxID=330485 RepID=A0A9W6F5R4_9CHLO|nr:ubiquitin-specific protease ubp15 [Pleodorina starrii]GLC57492.1 ubiquitin-specific protease ubp15 [Pleodorina starrii]GLC63166.1 ubiquitin-specific protease ubp15 [Pleodorina starrii]
MTTTRVRQCPEASDTYEWELQNFLSLDKKQISETFIAQGYLWRLTCFPRQNVQPSKHVSLFLECPAVENTLTTQTERLPVVDFTLTVVNHKRRELHLSKGTSNHFTTDQVDWGFSSMLPLTDVSIDSGFLRDDGALVVRLKMNVKTGKRPCQKRGLAPNLGADFLTLLEDPGPTSDLTLTAGGRSFPVHRAILAARCEFFKTMFASGFDDSTSKQVAMPDTDPDALQLLLRFIYGGVLDSCPQALLKPAAELADRLRLTEARAELEDCILSSASPDSIINDMLWAEVLGSEALSKALQEDYLQGQGGVDEEAISALAMRSPKLAATLLSAAMARIRESAMQQ